jgi:polyisoprenoid-binding protein YceI
MILTSVGRAGAEREAMGCGKLLALAVASLSLDTFASSTEYTIDPAHTRVTFEVRRLGISSQSGEFSSVAGTVKMDAAAGHGSIDIAVDTRSVRAGSNTMENFLRGPGVLNVEQYTEIAYKADRVVFAGGKPERIDGELTLLGVTRPVSLIVVGYRCVESGRAGQERCMLDATAVFRRSEFGMTRYLAIVSDEVKLAIHGVAED